MQTGDSLDTAGLLIGDAGAQDFSRPASVIGVTHAQLMSASVLASGAKRNGAMAGGRRHSMGGQSLPAHGGTAIELPETDVKVDLATRTYVTGGGTRWRTVSKELARHGLSVAVMQSNNDFSVGGSMSVNAHGWAAPHPPLASTVESFRLIKADGAIVTCSRTENADLFGLVLGGYGSLGVILDARLRAVPEQRLLPERVFMGAADLGPEMVKAAVGEGVRMVYGRLSVHSALFLEEAMLCLYRAAPGEVPLGATPELSNRVARAIFELQKRSDAGKAIRWLLERHVEPRVETPASRASLLGTTLEVFQTRTPGYADILHEYFLPPENFGAFLEVCRDIIPRYRDNLLNVTCRYVRADEDTVLRYAPAERISAVMLFHEKISSEADASMQAMTRRLIDVALDLGGSFYLPYRMHASREQFWRAYPRMDEFLAGKKRHDPQVVFRDALSARYG